MSRSRSCFARGAEGIRCEGCEATSSSDSDGGSTLPLRWTVAFLCCLLPWLLATLLEGEGLRLLSTTVPGLVAANVTAGVVAGTVTAGVVTTTVAAGLGPREGLVSGEVWTL